MRRGGAGDRRFDGSRVHGGRWFRLSRADIPALIRVSERIDDHALIEKMTTSQLAAITRLSGRSYVQVEWICKNWPTPHDQFPSRAVSSADGPQLLTCF